LLSLESARMLTDPSLAGALNVMAQTIVLFPTYCSSVPLPKWRTEPRPPPARFIALAARHLVEIGRERVRLALQGAQISAAAS
jgi:hypothetical protein